jgi:hypothetical protein
MSSIWVHLKHICGGATGNHVTGSDVTGSDITGSHVIESGLDRK